MNNKVKFLRGTSDEYTVAEKDSDTIYFTTDDGKLYIGDKEISGSDITIDDALSDTSTNPVQNKVVKQAIDNKADKTVATTSADGLMSAEDKGKLDNADNTYALKAKYGDTTIDVGRKAGTDVGRYSVAVGQITTASGLGSHAEGGFTIASEDGAHAEGWLSTASNNNAHAEGYETTASGSDSHAEGRNTTASGSDSHAEGDGTTASGESSHAEGSYTTASGVFSHAGGKGTKALHYYEVAYGRYNVSNDDTLFSIGDGASDTARRNAFEITKTGGKLHDKDIATTDLIPTTLPANGGTADTARQVTSPSSKVRLYEDNEGGNLELVAPDGVHMMQMDLYNNEGFRIYFYDGSTMYFPVDFNFSTGKFNIDGDSTTVNGHTVDADIPADAKFTDTVPDLTPYALKSKYGDTTINVGRESGSAVGEYSTAEGFNTTASKIYSHAEGAGTTSSGHASHAEGFDTTASGYSSHAEGFRTTASGYYSHAGGSYTKALHMNEVAYGSYNESNDNTLFSIGDGTSDSARHNAFEITTSGGMLHDKDILTSAHCIQFIPHNMKYYAQNNRILLFSNDDALARGIYFVNNTPNEITVCALISASAAGPAVQYGYGSNTYPEIQNSGDGREWFSEESIPTSPTIFAMTVPSGKLGYYGVYHNSETAYTTIHDIRCPYFNYF